MNNQAYSSSGYIGDEKVVCRYLTKAQGRGIFYKDNPFSRTSSVLIFQLFLIFAFTRITHLLLRPLRQTLLVAQVLAGIIMGPSLLGQHEEYVGMIFPTASRMTLMTFAEFGIVIHFFRMGVQVNPKHIFRVRKEAYIIGLVGYTLSIAFAIVASNIVQSISPLEEELRRSVKSMVVVNALTTFLSTSSFLNELNILNSEIGRLALSICMVIDVCGWLMYFITFNLYRSAELRSFAPFRELFLTVCYFSIMFFLMRPLVIWISNRSPHGNSMKESQFLAIIILLLILGLSAQVVGQPAFFISFIFGLILPDGPPLGTFLTERLDSISSALLVPAYCTISGLKTDATLLKELKSSSGSSVHLILMAGYLGKFVGTIFPALYFQIQFQDSLALAFIMCTKGVVDLLLFNALYTAKMISNQPFTIVIFDMVFVTGLATIIVNHIYDPSKRYTSYHRRTIMDSEKEVDLKILVCIYNEDNVYPIINLLQASNPTGLTPLSVFVLQLMELAGRAAPILTKTEHTKCLSSIGSSSRHIINVFDQFEKHNQVCVRVQHFTSITPYGSMHDDICSMAMDTRASIVIVPFHKQWSINGNIEIPHPSIRTVNQNVLRKAPCSVGILIDRSQLSGKLSVVHENSNYQIAMLFLGGADDDEALTYSMRMAKHPNIQLTVFWIKSERHSKYGMEKDLDGDLMENIQSSAKDKDNVTFMEDYVNDGAGTTEVIRKLEGNFDLVITGRQHQADSPCTLGLTEWCDHPELGPIGDMLASSDFTFSVLVVQEELFYDQPKIIHIKSEL